MVKDGLIECPKHNGRFHLQDGAPARAPVCRGLSTYRLEDRAGCLYLHPTRIGSSQQKPPSKLRLRVVSNRNVASFIKELVLEPLDDISKILFVAGDYLQFEIPVYEFIRFSDFDIPPIYAPSWQDIKAFDLASRNAQIGRLNNYSLASNQAIDKQLKFNIRIALPPAGMQAPGAGSSYMFSLKAGDVVSALGPFGDFHIKPTQREMIYIGGGAGMAPLRSHLSYLFETEHTARKVSFWFGARSRKEIFYDDYFYKLAKKHSNFSFHLALSASPASDEWSGLTGHIHEVVFKNHLQQHANPKAVEYYLCGPPAMVDACYQMLNNLGVPAHQIASDEF